MYRISDSDIPNVPSSLETVCCEVEKEVHSLRLLNFRLLLSQCPAQIFLSIAFLCIFLVVTEAWEAHFYT